MKKASIRIVGPSDLVPLLAKYTKKKQEHFGLVALNSVHDVLFCKTMFIGSDNKVMVQPRNLFWVLCKKEASAFIIFHNHPSGNERPSPDDIRTTEKLRDCGDIMGIPLLDHIIVTNDTYYSFLENECVLGTHDEEVRVAERS